MSLGLFDVVGPIMHGPSSNHTGGANRIGYVAYKLMGGTPKQLTFCFHPIFMKRFAGHRSHIAMMAGCIGLREYDDACNDSLKLAADKGVTVEYEAVPLEEEPDRNTMRIKGTYDGITWDINGISVGGGNIVIDSINGLKVDMDGNGHVYFWIGKGIGEKAEQIGKMVGIKSASGAGDQLFFQSSDPLKEEALEEIRQIVGEENIQLERYVPSLFEFAEKNREKPLFTTFAELAEVCKEMPLDEAAILYECKRSGKTKEEVLNMGLKIVDVIDQSMKEGLKGENQLIGGFLPGDDGKKALNWAENDKSIVGPVFNKAIARALAMSEVNACAGRVVAVPTAGSAGGLPGTLFTVAERYSKTKEDLARAFLVAAAVGAVIGNKCSFSGSIGGCQAEVGIGAGMAAAGSVWLAGGSAEASMHGCAMAIKNLLGLICDPLAGPVEIPCIKRNAVGASTALMGAEMALAGIRSGVSPDDVVDALQDTQKRLPTALRGACVGGLAACPAAKGLQERWSEKLKQMQEM